MASVIEYSIDGGSTWRHGKTIEAWAAVDSRVLQDQRSFVRDYARNEHGNVERIITRVLSEDDPRGALNQPA
jgi:hypothetical protein